MRRVIAMLVLSLFVISGCTNKHIKRADAAAATYEWKLATEEYRRALQEDPGNAGLRRKFEYAKKQAIEQAMAIGRRCKETGDYFCLEKEMTFVVALDPTNAEAAKMLQSSKIEIASALIEKARQAAKNGKFHTAAKMLSEARDKSNNENIVTRADDVAKEMSSSAVDYVDALLRQPAPEDLESKLKRYSECYEIMRSVIQYAPERFDLLAEIKSRRDEAKEAFEKMQRDKRAAEEAARKREAANRNRIITFVGVLVNVKKANGDPWDGFRTRDFTKVTSAVKAALTRSHPVAAVLGILSEPTVASIGKPDVFGTVELFYNRRRSRSCNISMIKDSFTPQWRNVIWNNIDINNAYIKVTLFDKDLVDNDCIGTFEISSEELKAAANVGTILPVRVDKQTNGQVLFALVSVK